VRNPRLPVWARYSGFAVALISAAVVAAPSAGAQDPCALPNELSTVQAIISRTATLNANDVPTATNDPTDPPRGTSPPTGNDRRAEICANRLSAPQTIAVQAGTVVVATSGFTSAVMGRLDSVRGQAAAVGTLTSTSSLGADGLMGLGAGNKSRISSPGPASPLTVYAMGTFLGGSRADAPNLFGFDYDATSGTVGIEYSVNRNLIVGLAGNYTTTNADVHSGAAIDISAVQAAAYLSYATRQWFVDALAAYGSHDLDLVRPGVIDPVRSSTDANVFALAARGGYLFDFGGLRAGPIAGLTYIHSRVAGYTEKGDPDLSFTVSAQTIDSLTGSVGLRFLTSFQAGGNLVVPYLNVMLEHQFGDGARTLMVDQVQTTLFLPISTSFPNFETRTYGRIEGGITFQFGPDVSATVSAASTFARDESQDFRISTGMNFRF